MGRQTSGVYEDAKTGKWRVDKTHRGRRLQGRFESYEEAERWLIARCAEIDATGPIPSASMSFSQAVMRYMLEPDVLAKHSLQTEVYLLEPVVEAIGGLRLDEVSTATLSPFVSKRLTAGRAHKTINLALGVVANVLRYAHARWTFKGPDGRQRPVLERLPVLVKLPLEGHQRKPQPITWPDQRKLLPLLPPHLARMALFLLNTGVRDDVVVNLRWDWEIRVPLDGIQVSVFEVPKEHVKGQKEVNYVVCNSVAQSVIDSVRGQHEEFVFVWRRERVKHVDKEPTMAYRPIGETMGNTGWQNARAKANLDVHVHDLRHTVGMRLREAGVAEATISDVLWHKRPGITPHYSTVQVREIYTALERIKDETGQQNRSLRSLARELRGSKVPSATPKVPSVAAIGEASKCSRDGAPKEVLKGRVPSESLRQEKTA